MMTTPMMKSIFFQLQGVSLTEHLDASQKADMRAYMTLVTSVLGNAEVREVVQTHWRNVIICI